jgi:hypothetical protein
MTNQKDKLVEVTLTVPRSGPSVSANKGDKIWVGPLEAMRMFQAGQIEPFNAAAKKEVATAKKAEEKRLAEEAAAAEKLAAELTEARDLVAAFEADPEQFDPEKVAEAQDFIAEHGGAGA